MPNSSFTNFDRPYRRGVVLGLSLAELFIILVFLLLLTMFGYVASTRQWIEESTNQRELTEGERNTAESAAAQLEDQLAISQEENERMQEKIGTLIKDVNDINTLISTKDEEIERLTSEIDNFRDMLGTLAPAAAIGKRVQGAALNTGVSPDELLADMEKNESDYPGQDSPCWYRMAKRSNGEDYERALYVFDIRISDNSIFTKDIPAPSSEHQKQKAELDFDRTALDRELNYDKFQSVFLPFKVAGDNKKIRTDRRCTFYVRVWDATSITNKPGYKRAHNEVVQGIFNTYEIKENPWPH